MQGGLVVNIWSEFIKQKAEENNASYETIAKIFWKNKKLQNQWKAYKKEITKDIFVPEKRSVPVSTIQMPPKSFPISPPVKPTQEEKIVRPPTIGEEFARYIEEEPNVFLDIEEVIVGNPPTQSPLISPTKKRGRPVGSKNKTKSPMPEYDEEPTKKAKIEPEPTPESQIEDFEKRYPTTKYLHWRNNTPYMVGGVKYDIPNEEYTAWIRLLRASGYKRRDSSGNPEDRYYEYAKEKNIKGKGFEEWLPFIRKNYPPKIRKFLEQRGDEVIEKLTIGRTPLEKVSLLLLNTVTKITMGNTFKKRQKEMNYDDLYHLELIITTTEKTYFSIEKNEVINIRFDPVLKPETQLMDVSNIPPNLTINEMLRNAEQRMGKKYFVYNAATNNCQDFVLALLEANGMGSPQEKEFIKQDVQYLFKGAKGTVNFASLLSSIAAIRNRIIEGAGLYKVQSVLFNRKQWANPEKAGEWLKSHSYLNKGVDVKEDTYRFRQINPQYIKKKGYKRFVTQPLGDSGVSLILAYKK